MIGLVRREAPDECVDQYQDGGEGPTEGVEPQKDARFRDKGHDEDDEQVQACNKKGRKILWS